MLFPGVHSWFLGLTWSFLVTWKGAMNMLAKDHLVSWKRSNDV